MAEPADLELRWTRARAAGRLRELFICGVLGPLMDLYTRRRVAGRKRPQSPSASLAFGTVLPEGTRSRDGRAGRLRLGAALPAAELEIRFRKPLATRAGERPSEVMGRARLFVAECGAETGREPHAEHADRRQRA